jgi:hypothetical protein
MFSIVAVPELPTWAMILTGFAGVAWAAARSRQMRASFGRGEATARPASRVSERNVVVDRRGGGARAG